MGLSADFPAQSDDAFVAALIDENIELRTAVVAQDWAVTIVSSEAFMWLMAGSNHVGSHLTQLREGYDQYIAAGGKTWGK